MINKHNKKILIVAFSLILLFVLVIIYYFKDIKKINLKVMEDYIKSYGSWSIAAFLVISAVRPLAVFIPITFITLISGSLYGPIYGFLLAMASIIISSNVAFLISRYLGKSFFERLIKKRVDRINLRVEKSGFKIIFFMRIAGVFPLDILSYAAGLTKVRYRDFMLATILGSMAETFSVANMGHNIKDPLSPGFIYSVVLVIIIVGLPLLYNKVKASKNKNNEKR
ncbi:MAG: TVP38/TMEM64 family protein [Ruminiclostridium sp.]